MLPQTTKDLFKKWGIDTDALVAAANDPVEKPFAFEVKPETIKANFADHSFMSTDELNGLKGRVKTETLTQAEEIGIKAIKDKAGLTFDGKDPGKFIEALTAHLKIPVDSKLTEKENDIKTLQGSVTEWKTKFEGLEKSYKDRQDLDTFAKLLPANKTKILKDAEVRSRYADDGYTVGEYDDNGTKKQALFKNGEVQKDKELKLLDPKTHIAEWMKTGNLLEAEVTSPGGKKTFDVRNGGNSTASKFNHESAYEAALAAGGGVWNEKAQASYTEAQLQATKAA